MDTDSSIVVSDAISRLRLLERRQETLREKLLIVNQNMVDEYKKLLFEVRSLVSDIKEIKNNLNSAQESMKLIIKDADSFARKDQLKVLEKYINLWDPLHFVTEEEVINLIKKRAGHATRKKVSKRRR
jgi:hypothetical protein